MCVCDDKNYMSILGSSLVQSVAGTEAAERSATSAKRSTRSGEAPPAKQDVVEISGEGPDAIQATIATDTDEQSRQNPRRGSARQQQRAAARLAQSAGKGPPPERAVLDIQG